MLVDDERDDDVRGDYVCRCKLPEIMSSRRPIGRNPTMIGHHHCDFSISCCIIRAKTISISLP